MKYELRFKSAQGMRNQAHTKTRLPLETAGTPGQSEMTPGDGDMTFPSPDLLPK
jgi:hypothetical protein